MPRATGRATLRLVTGCSRLAAVIILLLGTQSAKSLAIAPAALAEPNSVRQARAELERLTVAKPHPLHTYKRAEFMTDWSRQKGACDTREIVLLLNAWTVGRDAACSPISGIWYSPYDGRTLTSTDQIDVDHVVPLANAWISGADTWSPARRHAFANDVVRPELIPVSESSNLAKGGHSPANWRPSVTEYWCTYARAWITVKHHYRLHITSREKNALDDMLDTCPSS
ncbi:GmrSD restriction endonuclease domain-containing protein [Nonomuraea turcica]|uniref:GmrSD restriction endonuclease domain-containing protein n=1 Tax=Nonomuraea sp. G32 TaxID=3067274 RepID=UPI00273B2ED4|nr:DUF1524 domain-containing protein [Nonomuraea sp. G32]MDP4501829.1 DUF1524 domain-containing protein [Nonomuraea sp. G32]